jgi:hypothetical protein
MIVLPVDRVYTSSVAYGDTFPSEGKAIVA